MYGEYLGRLLVEGNDDAVGHFLAHELTNRGLESHRDRIEKAVRKLQQEHADCVGHTSKRASSISRQRAALVKKWSLVGVAGREAIRMLFAKLVSRQQLDLPLCNSVLRLCYDSESQLEVGWGTASLTCRVICTHG